MIATMRGSALLLAALTACGGTEPADAGPTADAGPMADAGPNDAGRIGVDAGDGGELAPSLEDALDCRNDGAAGGLARGSELMRHDFDLGAFPDALCNDGTGAVMYFRPYEGEANRDRWVIQLQGGGGCRSGDDCAARWCSVDTNFGATQMSATTAPEGGIDGRGIMDRTPPVGTNPLGDYNHVFVRYCSSDQWSGTVRDLELEGAHPVRTGETVRYRAHFLGARILGAALATLRRDGVPALVHATGGELPDLDDATEVVLAGASAGGGGTTHNLDFVHDALRAANSRCTGGVCPLIVRGIIDSIFPPSFESLDVSTSALCAEQGLCDAQALFDAEVPFATARGIRSDASCQAWHEANAPETISSCLDTRHVLSHHVTTPFVVRMGLTDSLISRSYIESGYSVAGYGPLDLRAFARLVQEQLIAMPDIVTTAEERDAISVAPAVYGPVCPKHETLSSTPDTFRVTIDDGGLTRFFDVWDRWIAGTGTTTVVSAAMGDTACP